VRWGLSVPRADRGPRAGSPRGVVDATGSSVQRRVLIRLATARGTDTVNSAAGSNTSLDRGINQVNHSPMTLASIRNEIEKLEPAERATLIDVLWESLDEERIKEIEGKWASESEDRIDAFERGELSAVDGRSAIEELRSSLRK
jgi:putative addiction module component (TIGR02574 family)